MPAVLGKLVLVQMMASLGLALIKFAKPVQRTLKTPIHLSKIPHTGLLMSFLHRVSTSCAPLCQMEVQTIRIRKEITLKNKCNSMLNVIG